MPRQLFRTDSLKTYIFFWVTLLALAMALLLSYQSTQYFLKGLNMITGAQMEEAAELLPEGQREAELPFGYHVAADWQSVPKAVRDVFIQPPQQLDTLQLHFENWWYFAPPERAFFLLASRNQQGKLRFISMYDPEHEHAADSRPDKAPEEIDPMVKIALWGLGAIVIYVLLIYRVLGSLAQPVQSLYHWARELQLETLTPQRPDFQYQELNALATILHNSLQDVSQTLAREREFLGFASHELRTPIATLRSSATLLDKVNPRPSAKEREVRDRILRASLAMKGITETLLWLNRDEQQLIPTREIAVDQLVQRVVAEQRYLLSGKAVELKISITPCLAQLPEDAFQILLTNLIRNAFQHTISGHIQINQSRDQIEIINSLVSTGESAQAGFGLGLKLTRKLVQRFGWKLLEEQHKSENRVRLGFRFQTVFKQNQKNALLITL
ncbi:MAG: HAMP domain-containing histidine kinase [Marinobacterium sp.]|nr:HAMP domain-containing histidine kinase [Marinobacterium sp.]